MKEKLQITVKNMEQEVSVDISATQGSLSAEQEIRLLCSVNNQATSGDNQNNSGRQGDGIRVVTSKI